MLMSDLQHDLVMSFVSALDHIDWKKLNSLIDEMQAEGNKLLAEESIPTPMRQFTLQLDCRYVKQYHEVSFVVPRQAVQAADIERIAALFHDEHHRMYGYSLRDEDAPIELINVRVRAVGVTQKPSFVEEPRVGADAQAALKGERELHEPEEQALKRVPVYDGDLLRHGHRIAGPALIEQDNTTLLLTASFDCACDRYGSFVVYRKGNEEWSMEKGELQKSHQQAS
jgi:N-methylhydantoinase A